MTSTPASPQPAASAPKKARKGKKRPKPKKANGRPRYQPSDLERGSVKSLSAAGYSEDHIAAYMRIDPKTLRKHFPDELAFATMELLGAAVGGLAQALKEKQAWAICFVLKTRGKKLHNGVGWSERTEIAGPEGGAIPVRLSSLSDTQLEQLLTRLQAG